MNGKKTKHIVMGGNGVRCLHCGQEQGFMGGGISLNVMIGICEGFEKDHLHCEFNDAGRARWTYSTPDEWRESWDTGISSEIIHHVLGGGKRPSFTSGCIPLDPDDFGRCVRLLDVAPAWWRGRLGEVAAAFPEWEPLVEAWEELETLYQEEKFSGELPFLKGSAPKLFERLKELRAKSKGSEKLSVLCKTCGAPATHTLKGWKCSASGKLAHACDRGPTGAAPQ